jgi:hypothetical protein
MQQTIERPTDGNLVRGSLLKAREEKIRKDAILRGVSPLYGEDFKVELGIIDVDLKVLHEPEILTALDDALAEYQEELANKGYTTLTINSYSSAVNRFIDFLRVGQVIPDFDNKPNA